MSEVYDELDDRLRPFIAKQKMFFVGWHMCGIIDTSKEMPGKEQHQHQGLMTTHGEFYPEVEQAIQQLSSRLYNIASGR